MAGPACPDGEPVLHKWLVAGFMDKSVFHPTVAGTPQGGVASPVLANMALDGLQRALEERFPCKEGSNRHQVYLVRYADDFVVTGDSAEILESEVRPIMEAFLAERGLRLSAEKTVVRHVDEGFDFLGMTVPNTGARCSSSLPRKGSSPFWKVSGSSA